VTERKIKSRISTKRGEERYRGDRGKEPAAEQTGHSIVKKDFRIASSGGPRALSLPWEGKERGRTEG